MQKKTYTFKDYKIHLKVVVGLSLLAAYLYYDSKYGNPIDNLFSYVFEENPKLLLVFVGIYAVGNIIAGYVLNKKGHKLWAGSQYLYALIFIILIALIVI